MASPVLGDDLQKLYPISFAGQSDTATFDNCLELLTMAGYPHRPGRDDDDSRSPGSSTAPWTSAAAPSTSTTPP